MAKDFSLYYAALAADHAWHTALVARYGHRNAGDARYTSAGVETPELLALSKAKKAADEAWLEEMRLPNRSQGEGMVFFGKAAAK